MQSNVLIDDCGRAVINDFDNTCLEGDALPPDRRVALRHRSWSSPEILKGASPKRTNDIYTFGMTIVEVSNKDLGLYDLIVTLLGSDLH